jgi:hypothetical protein
LDLIPDGSIPIRRTKRINWGLAHWLFTYVLRSDGLPSIHKAAEQDRNESRRANRLILEPPGSN